MTLEFRRAAARDVPMLAELAARTFPLACPPELDAAAIAAFVRANLSEESFHRYLAAPGHRVVVGADSDGDGDGDGGDLGAYALLVDGTAMDEACAGLVVARPTVGVSKFYVDPTLHGTGAARGLLEAVIGHARAGSAASLWLATNIGNARARSFYRRVGFEERGERDFIVGGVRNRDVVLELALPAPGAGAEGSASDGVEA